MLALVAFREYAGFGELSGRAAHMWFTFWDWFGLGVGTWRRDRPPWMSGVGNSVFLPRERRRCPRSDRIIFLVGT